MSEKTKLLPGDFAIWIFIFAELTVFAIYFVIYAVVRMQNVEMFNHFQLTLNRETGAINTILLITGSYFVVKSVDVIKQNKIKECYKFLYWALVCGCVFVVIKSYEFYMKFSVGIGLDTNTFYMFYLSLTLFHYFHVILGMAILLAIAIKAQRGSYDSNNYTGVESGASYWHMVDLVWIILFPLIYIIR